MVLQLLYLTSQGFDVPMMKRRSGIRQPVPAVDRSAFKKKSFSPVDRANLLVLNNGRRPSDLSKRIVTTAAALEFVRGKVSHDTCRRLLEAFFGSDLTGVQCEDRKLRRAAFDILDFILEFLTRPERRNMLRLARQAGFADCAQLITAPAH